MVFLAFQAEIIYAIEDSRNCSCLEEIIKFLVEEETGRSVPGYIMPRSFSFLNSTALIIVIFAARTLMLHAIIRINLDHIQAIRTGNSFFKINLLQKLLFFLFIYFFFFLIFVEIFEFFFELFINSFIYSC